jgi:steroid delta-isomerase-like uncharacterized protein
MTNSVAATRAVIRRYYAAFNAKDWDGMLACVADDVVHYVNEGDVRKGRAPFREFIAHMERCYDERLADIVVLTNKDGARAAAEFTVHGKYLATDPGLPEARGQTYILPAGAFFTISGGLIGRVTTYYNLKDWLAQIARAG